MKPTGWKVRAHDDRGDRWLDDDGEFAFFECDSTTFTTTDQAVVAACVNYPPSLSRDVEWVLVPVWGQS